MLRNAYTYYNETKIIYINLLPSKYEKEQFFSELSSSPATSVMVDFRFEQFAGQIDFFRDLFISLNQNKNIQVFTYNGNGNGHSRESFAVIAAGIGQCQFLTEVTLHCPIYPDLLANAVRNSISITKLNLASCGIRDISAIELADAIMENTSLVDLDLTGTAIKDIGAFSILMACIKQGSIRTLCLRNNKINDDYLADMIDALASNRTLTYLDLQFMSKKNPNVMVKVICARLTKDHFREAFLLDLRENEITDEGAEVILSTLKTGKYPLLLKIDLRENNIKKQLLDEIDKQIKLAKEIEISNAALACTTLQQGARQNQSVFSYIPEEVLEMIYARSFPFPTMNKEMSHFTSNIFKKFNNPTTFFNRTPKVIEAFDQNKEILSALTNKR